MRIYVTLAICLLATAQQALSQDLPVIGGETSVVLGGTDEEQANLDLAVVTVTDIGGDTFASPTLEGGVAFPIDPASTFMFTDASLLPVSGGPILHSGTVEISTGLGDFSPGNFSIGYDPTRPGTNGFGSGFFIQDTADILGIMFDFANPAPQSVGLQGLRVAGDLLVSPELAGTLGNSALAGADVGDALVNAEVPAPSSLTLVLGLTAVALVTIRRR